jgi:hypothetical protein
MGIPAPLKACGIDKFYVYIEFWLRMTVCAFGHAHLTQ